LRTKETFRGSFEVWLDNLGLDAAHDGRLSEANECRAVRGRDGTDVHEWVAPVCTLAAVWAALVSEKAFEIDLWMEPLKYVGVRWHR
jgi:hypothetical protein